MPQPSPKPASGHPRAFVPGAIVYREAQRVPGDLYEFCMASDAVDRMGDVVEIGGLDLASFKQNPIALWQHDARNPIGTWENVRKSGNRLVGKLKLAAAGTSQLVDRLREFIEQGILQSVSIGFRMIEAEPIEKGGWALRFTKSELLECSVVSIPANADARRIRAMNPHPADSILFPANADQGDRSRRIAAGQPSPRRQLASGTKDTRPMPKTIAERITALQTRSATIDDEIARIQEDAAAEDDREFSAEETEQLSALAEEKRSVIKSVDTLTETEAAMALRAQASGPGMAMMPAQVARKETPGFMIGKIATIAALSHVQKQPPERIIASRYAHDPRVAACFDYVKRTAAKIADSTTVGWAAELVQQDVAAFLADIENLSVFATLRARPSSIALAGQSFISIPRRNKGGMAGAWVGETGVIPVLQGVIAAAKLEPTKLAGITTFSKELENASNQQIESILTNGLRIDTAEVLDKALLDNNPKVVGVRPGGLRNGAASAASGGATAAGADIKAAIDAILTAGGGQDIVLIMHPSQANGLMFAENMMGMPAFPEVAANGTFHGYPIISSLNVTAGTVIVVDAAFFASQADVPDIDVSEEATLTMANADATAPTQAVDFTGVVATAGQVVPDGGILVAGGPAGAGTAGYQAMSMFQQWAVAVRLVMPVHWVMIKTGMVSVITGVAWS